MVLSLPAELQRLATQLLVGSLPAYLQSRDYPPYIYFCGQFPNKLHRVATHTTVSGVVTSSLPTETRLATVTGVVSFQQTHRKWLSIHAYWCGHFQPTHRDSSGYSYWCSQFPTNSQKVAIHPHLLVRSLPAYL
ncbi:hypothetical protein RRG08_063109 [Elysia crispata]|uniref:Uncharacterized protein n=1 Tax=Elysia crispata TaxID=231223 RepID=A0AAE1CYL8_9GAST|nr:hypothetical protein RRG08_063109 [Elysia crispata]